MHITQSFQYVNSVNAERYYPNNGACVGVRIVGYGTKVAQSLYFGENKDAALAFFRALGGTDDMINETVGAAP